MALAPSTLEEVDASRGFLQTWMDCYVAWVGRHTGQSAKVAIWLGCLERRPSVGSRAFGR